MPFRKSKPWGATKPPCGTPLDGDSINSGLVCCALLNEGAGKLCKNLRGYGDGTIGGNAVFSQNLVGQGVAITINGSDQISFGSNTLFQSGEVTAEWLGTWDGTNTGGNALIFSNVASSKGFELAVDTTTGVLWWATTNSFAVNNTTFTAVAKIPFHVLFTHSVNLGLTVYVNNKVVATNATTTALSYTAGSVLSLGQRGDSAVVGLPGVCNIYRQWSRALSATEGGRLFQSPYIGLATPRRRIISGASASFVPWGNMASFDASPNEPCRVLAY